VNASESKEFKGTSGNFFAVKFNFPDEKPKLKNEGNSDKIYKEIESLRAYITGLQKKLNNQNFIAKAAPDVIDKEKSKLSEAEEKLDKLIKML
jgi:valyl-tRNA synthetase